MSFFCFKEFSIIQIIRQPFHHLHPRSRPSHRTICWLPRTFHCTSRRNRSFFPPIHFSTLAPWMQTSQFFSSDPSLQSSIPLHRASCGRHRFCPPHLCSLSWHSDSVKLEQHLVFSKKSYCQSVISFYKLWVNKLCKTYCSRRFHQTHPDSGRFHRRAVRHSGRSGCARSRSSDKRKETGRLQTERQFDYGNVGLESNRAMGV